MEALNHRDLLELETVISLKECQNMHLMEKDPGLFQEVMDTEIFNWAKHTKQFNIARFNKYEVLYGDHVDWFVNKPIRYSTKNFLSRA